MHFGSLLMLAVGLAMDAAAAAASRGLAAQELRPRHFAIVAVFFGGSQALMPLLGWLLGAQLGPSVAAWDHWIAFVLLVGLGGKMIHEARGRARNPELVTHSESALFGMHAMSVLAVATSIDAFAVGVTLPMLQAPLLLSVATIGLTTALLSALALAAGRKLGAKLGAELDVFGGVVLVLLGTKILIEHLRAS